MGIFRQDKTAFTAFVLPVGLISAHGCLYFQVAVSLPSICSTPTEVCGPHRVLTSLHLPDSHLVPSFILFFLPPS